MLAELAQVVTPTTVVPRVNGVDFVGVAAVIGSIGTVVAAVGAIIVGARASERSKTAKEQAVRTDVKVDTAATVASEVRGEHRGAVEEIRSQIHAMQAGYFEEIRAAAKDRAEMMALYNELRGLYDDCEKRHADKDELLVQMQAEFHELKEMVAKNTAHRHGDDAGP